MKIERSAGVLLHPTSLPGRAIGDLGEAAFQFVDWLAGAGQTLWQVLPLTPVSGGGSPYNSLSAFAGNPLLVSPELLVEDGLLAAADVQGIAPSSEPVEYLEAIRFKETLLDAAHTAFREGAAPHLRAEFDAFRARAADWLPDYARFAALRDEHDEHPWSDWDVALRQRDPGALHAWSAARAGQLERQEFAQWLFDRQWQRVRRYAAELGIKIIGDIPIFVAYDSADVWSRPDLFYLDETGCPVVVSGVPPDYFSETGQLWGNPLYRWEVMDQRGYDWWIRRFRRTLEQVDIARIDHFRGFESYWEIPAGEATAIGGQWRTGPGAALFRAAERALGELPLIAEDLGLITPEVEALRKDLGLPGMRVLQFAFGDEGAKNPHLPANHPVNCVAYTGTHDNDTSVGWYEDEADAETRASLRDLFPPGSEGDAIHWHMIGLVWGSPARAAIAPVQDILGLGSEARMNTPGEADGNWAWRLDSRALTPEVQQRLRTLTEINSRVNS